MLGLCQQGLPAGCPATACPACLSSLLQGLAPHCMQPTARPCRQCRSCCLQAALTEECLHRPYRAMPRPTCRISGSFLRSPSAQPSAITRATLHAAHRSSLLALPIARFAKASAGGSTIFVGRCRDSVVQRLAAIAIQKLAGGSERGRSSLASTVQQEPIDDPRLRTLCMQSPLAHASRQPAQFSSWLKGPENSSCCSWSSLAPCWSHHGQAHHHSAPGVPWLSSSHP